MSFESKFSSICRTCLTETHNMKSVFTVEEFTEETVPLCDILMSFTSLQVRQGDGLPDQVCTTCVVELNRTFLFKKLCERSNTTLKRCIETLPPIPETNGDLSVYIFKMEDADRGEKHEAISSETEQKLDLPDDDCKLDVDDVYHDDSIEESEETDDDTHKQKKKSRRKKRKQVEDEPKKKVYPCKECKALCLGLGEYRRHVAESHGKIFKCETCNKRFRSEVILNRHFLSHNEDCKVSIDNPKPHRNKTGIIKKRNLPRTCDVCNKTFRFHSNLERHKLIHTGEKPYLCNVCGKGFAQLSYLKIHSFIHTGEKPYNCKMCEKSFAAPGTLMTHIRTHTGERPHVCKICGKDFPQSGYLSAHIRTHTGEKPVECKVCHRRFNQSGRLIIHMRIHSGEKPYSCVECGRSFAVKGTLKKHIRTHTGERPYICSSCGQAFAQSGTLATHMKVHKPK